MNPFHRKRSPDIKDEFKDDKRIKKLEFIEVQPQNDTKDKYFDEILSDEYQPQFLNYQLMGDLLAIMILNSKSLMNRTRLAKPVRYQNFCHSAWSARDLLDELTTKKNCHPVAKTVILSVGYNDYQENRISALMLAEYIEKIVLKLQRRGCRDIILTNIPPCAANNKSLDHWKYLQIINDQISTLSEKYDFICHFNVFDLFCLPNNIFGKKEYVTFGEINYKIYFEMYNSKTYSDRPDLVTFSDLGKVTLGKSLAKMIEKRKEYLRRGKVSKVICVLEETGDVEPETNPIEIIDTDEKFVKTKNSPDVIDLADSDEDNPHEFGCPCKSCKDDNQQLLRDMLSCLDDTDVKEEKPVLI